MIDNLEDAINHARKKAQELRSRFEDLYRKEENTEEERKEAIACLDCSKEHAQLVAWLTELAERREADKWNIIHTEADLPKESDWYLVTRVFNSKKYVATVFFNENTKSFYEDSCTPLNNITHWKPLPKPYESEDK